MRIYFATAIASFVLVVSIGVSDPRAQAPVEGPMEGQDMSGGMEHHMHHDHHLHHGAGVAEDDGYRHRFEKAEEWAKDFDDPQRDAWQKPEVLLDALQLQPGARVADIGAGTGYFSIRIAKRIPEGKIFAVDVEPDMVRYLGERAKREGLRNVIPVEARADDANLPESVDLALVVDTYHHIGHRVAYFAKLKTMLSPGARLAIVDFKADSPNGPPASYRIPAERVVEELRAAGYELIETHPVLPRQYFLVFRVRAS
jgi:ubiquinone/menaquinone biosynthesis C-methylase UbiE